jgi:4-amino-4-deoxy-L-arabinose transferase-like glycosyltransferase
MSKELNLKLLLFFTIIFAFFINLGFVPLFDLDEGAFSEATREMLESGNYLTTYLNGELRFDKPILIYWFQALSVKIFGLNEFALRFPSAVAASVWIYITYLFAQKFMEEKRAFLVGFFMISSLQITIISKAAIADALLNLFIALSMFMIYKFYKSENKKYIYLTYLFVALGTLTKGPVAIMIPLIVSLIFFSIKGEFKRWLRAIFDIKAIALFLLVAAPWYVAEYMDQGEKFINGFFLKHNISRFNSAMEGHYGTFFYYVPVFLVGLLPFTYFYIKIFGKIKEMFSNDLHLFLIVWFLFVFIFFSFSGTKLPHYVIYGYTPIFLLAMLYFDEQKVKDFWLIFPSVLLYIILLLLPIVLKNGAIDSIRDDHAKNILNGSMHLFDIKYFISLILAIILSIYLVKINIDKFKKILIIGIVFISIINFIILPLVGQAQQEPIKEAALIAKKDNLNVKMYRINTPSFSFYSQKVTKRQKPKIGEIILTKSSKLKAIKKYHVIYESRGIALVKVEEL